MEIMEATVKKYITSLLTSTPLVVTMQQLSKDYRNTIGEPIPYQKLGYNSLEHLLRSIPDTVEVKGVGLMAQVIPVLSEKSAHINKLVTSQKVTTKKKRQCFVQKRTKTLFPTDYKFPAQIPKTPQNVPSPTPMKKMYYPPAKSHISSTNYSTPSVYPKNTRPEQSHNSSSPKVFAGPAGNITTPLVIDFPKNNVSLKQTNTLENIHKEKLEESDIHTSTSNWVMKTKKLNDVDRISVEVVETSVPLHIRNNLRILIGRYPEGVWCAEVPDIYRKMFRHKLDYQELGFKSLIHLCVTLSSIFHYVRPSTEDYKLYDRSKPLPQCVEKTFTMASFATGHKKFAEVDSGSALPDIGWKDVKKFLPQDIFMVGEEIPRAFISHDTKEGDSIHVVVGEVYDLSKFWVYMDDAELDQLMDEIQEFYKEHNQEYLVPSHLIKEGMYCVQQIFGEYHRALIVDRMPEVEDTIRVIFFDYGTMAKVPSAGICFLHLKFSALPAQAIRCRLANVFPPEEGMPWSREASKAFRKLVANKDLSAKINHINWEEQYLEVYLVDMTDDANVFYINDRLVEEGFAQEPGKERKVPIVDPIHTPIVKYLHLFPTFLELEYGLAPSTSEMEIFNDLNVPVNFCYPQYFYIDHSKEEKVIKAAEEFHERNCIKAKRRTPSSRYYDSEAFKTPELDLSIFGDLREDIEEFMNREVRERPQSDDEDFADADEDFLEELQKCGADSSLPTSDDLHVDASASDLQALTEQFVQLHIKENETVNVLKKDLEVTENIMKDINDLCIKLEFPTESSVNLPDSATLTFDNLHEDKDMECGVSKNDSSNCSDSEIQVEMMNHPLSAMNFEDDFALQDESTTNDPTYDLHLPDVHLSSTSVTSLHEEDPVSAIDRLKAETDRKINDFLNAELCLSPQLSITGSESTNPFLSDLPASIDLEIDLTKLNPKNPFLNFLQNDNSDASSNASTDYESPVVAKSQHSWSSFSDMSAETISQLGKSLCSRSSSSTKSTKLEDQCTCSTQTLTKENKAIQVVENVQYRVALPPRPPVAPSYYPAWSSGGYNSNPYYSVRFSNYQSFLYESQFGPGPAGPPGLGPPPGFFPSCPPNGCPVRGYGPPPGRYGPSGHVQYGQQGAMCFPPVQNPQQQQLPRLVAPHGNAAVPQEQNVPSNGVERAAAVLSTSGNVGSANRDFYDVYNMQFQHRLQSSGQ